MNPILQKYWLLVALIGGTVAGGVVYFVTSSGQPTTDLTQVARICNLPAIIPASFLAPLGIPQPTQPDGTGVGSCLSPDVAQVSFEKLYVAKAIWPAWNAAGLDSTHCAAGIVATEFGAPTVSDAGDSSTQSEVLIAVCGPAPSAASVAGIMALPQLPGTSVNIVSTFGPFAKQAGMTAIQWWPQGSYPAAVQSVFPCACRPRSDVAGNCLYNGVAAPFATQLDPPYWSGSCTRKQCGEFLGTIEGGAGKNYSMPVACQ
jgi:hypothetical protein